MPLTNAQRRHWSDEGYLVVEGFFDDAEVDAVEQALQRTWERRPSDVTVDDLLTGRRMRAREVTDEHRAHRFKVNDLYLSDARLRGVISSERVVDLLGELLEDQPVVCNTLNLDKGSQQADHLDTLYMTPRTEGKLVATWMALEDTHADAGPLRYWPGSHHIEPFRFADGSLHVEQERMEEWSGYMADSVQRRGLEEQRFLARRGDLFIWSALLLHGGSDIRNVDLTRKSLVTHFFAAADCTAQGLRTEPVEHGAGRWWDRPPQPIPGEEMTDSERELAAMREAEQLVVTPRRPAVARPTRWDRLRGRSSSRH
ncbi:MAG TPA: phytanoyl-CoA dioxygenase family protein [Acidimicrobiales bacterium]|nr:phytanoyl-CoA dioxygenase family protein [Acidimicrobiales bacterium]